MHLNTINCGWEVLCKFTNQEIPQNTNWPHQNKDGKGLFETRQYTAKDFYDPFAKIENPFMAQIKYEANKNALIMLIAVILIVILATGI